MLLHRPEELFSLVYNEEATSGRVVLARKVSGRVRKTHIPPHLFRKMSGQLYNYPDISFSSVIFTGLPLLLNLYEIPVISISIKKDDDLTFNTAIMRLGHRQIPNPTVCIDDTLALHFLWVLEKPIQRNEFFIASIIKTAITSALNEMAPCFESKNIGIQIPLVGSINSKTGRNVGARSILDKVYRKDRLLEIALNPADGNCFAKMQKKAGQLMELQALLDYRILDLARSPELYEDWVIFIAGGLAPFCTPNQMFHELKALAESLEGLPWKSISEKYSALIGALSKSGPDGCFHLGGATHSFESPHLNDLIRGRLRITAEETSKLKLTQIGQNHLTSSYIHEIKANWRPVGNDDFVSESAFCMKAV